MPDIAEQDQIRTETEELQSYRTQVAALAADRYEVLRLLARGGMSVVLLALDRMDGRRVALKVLDPEQGASVENRERFRREALISAALEHPHVVPCHEFIYRGNLAMAVMRYVPGRSLADRVADGRRLSAPHALAILIPIADALARAHRQGVVHRDVKPANILLQEGDLWPFLTDFGIATLRTSEHSRSEVSKGFGTPAFMSPEQALGRWDADFRTDIYSLGLVAYRVLAGRLPFQGETDVSLAAQRATRDAPPLRSLAPEVPEALARIVDRCLARDPRRRWRTMAALRNALIRCRARPLRTPLGLARLVLLLGRLRRAPVPLWSPVDVTPAPLSR